MARGRWTFLLWPLVRGPMDVQVGEGHVRLRYGALGSFDVPVSSVDRLSSMRWPAWAGIGVRIAMKMVAFVGRSGPTALLEMSEPVRVRAPLPWRTERLAVGVEDVDGFLRAVAMERARADLTT